MKEIGPGQRNFTLRLYPAFSGQRPNSNQMNQRIEHMRLLVSCLIALTLWAALCGCASALDREAVENLVIIAEARMKDGDMKQARESLEKALQEDPSSQRALRAMGDYYFKEGDFEKARQQYEKAIKSGGSEQELNFLIGKCHFRGGEFERAANFLQMVKPGDENSGEYYFLVGESLRLSNDLDRALQNLKRAVDQNGADFPARLALGKTYAAKKMFQEARKELDYVAACTRCEERIRQEAKEEIGSMEKAILGERGLRMAVPLGVVLLTIPAFFALKSQKEKRASEEDDMEEFDG